MLMASLKSLNAPPGAFALFAALRGTFLQTLRVKPELMSLILKETT